MSLKPFKYLILENVWVPLRPDWHLNDTEYFLWLKVYCEVEHAVQNRETKVNRWIFDTFF